MITYNVNHTQTKSIEVTCIYCQCPTPLSRMQVNGLGKTMDICAKCYKGFLTTGPTVARNIGLSRTYLRNIQRAAHEALRKMRA